MKRFLVAIPVLLGLLSIGAAAQSVATAELHVTVKDPNGRLVTNAKVTVRDESRGIERSLENKPDGEYPFLSLPPGQYTVTVEAGGFARATAVGVRVTVGQAAELPVTLSVSGQKTEVTVSGETEMVETQQTSVSTTINQQRIDNLPINGRNYINFTLLNSQTARDDAPSIGIAPTSGLNVGGQNARSNLVNVDGMDAIDNSVNGVRSTVSQEAVQEFQLITNGYAAEYGRASGGVVNIVTRSGSNAFHGDAFGYLRNRDFQAINPFSREPVPGEKPAYTRVQTGLTVGGPIKKDKTFFFFSYETTRRQETGFSTIGADNFGLVQLPAALGGALVNATDQYPCIARLAGLPGADPKACPQANPAALSSYIQAAGAASLVATTGKLLGAPIFPSGVPLPASYVALSSIVGNYPVSEGTTLVALRLDHRFNSAQQGMLRVNVSPSTQDGISVQGQNQNFGQNAYSRTSIQQYRDFNATAQHTWLIGNDKINESRFQYARRGLLFDYNTLAPDNTGSQVAINIPGFAFFGREPFSYTRRTEQRYEFADNFSWVRGNHSFKFGADVNHLPVTADFTVNFGGLFDFGSISSALVNPNFAGYPDFSPVQAYGLGLPQDFIQGVGNPHDSFQNNTLGVFLQDSWRIRPNLTLNYGVRYDVEFTPTFAPTNPTITQPAQSFLGIVQGIPHDTNNVAPRIGLAWDPWKNGKTVVRASYGIFYDHPLLGLAFISDVADGSQAPQLGFPLLGAPTTDCTLNAASIFVGTLGAAVPGGCGYGYNPNQQRFNPNPITSLAFNPNNSSIFTNQNFLALGVPLTVLPFGFPDAQSFQYAYSNQASLGIEHDLGHDFSLSATYSFNGGRHLNRPINVNPIDTEALVTNWRRALIAGDPSAASGPNGVSGCGFVNGLPYVPAAVVSFFRPSGVNPSLAPFVPAPCMQGVVVPLLHSLYPSLSPTNGYPTSAPLGVPFADMYAQFGNGSSVYHALTLNLKKRFSKHYEFLGSYTYSHAIDDSVDLQSPLQPQDARFPSAERSTSLFDQRHRFVFSAVYQSGKLSGQGFLSKFFSNWTVAPIIEFASGRPFNIGTGSDQNLDQSSKTDRPSAVPANAFVNPICANAVVPSQFSPTGYLQATCFATATDAQIIALVQAGQPVPAALAAQALTEPVPVLDGNLKRNAGVKPMTVFTDMRIARRIPINERFSIDAMADGFNLINRFNVADVNPLFNAPGGAGVPTAAFDPRQFQFALKLSW